MVNFLMFQVCAPSCHDCSTLRAWWEEDEGRRSRFYKNVVGSNEEPPSRCTPEVVHFIVQQHFDAPSMWAIFPLQVRNLKLYHRSWISQLKFSCRIYFGLAFIRTFLHWKTSTPQGQHQRKPSMTPLTQSTIGDSVSWAPSFPTSLRNKAFQLEKIV